MAPITGLYTFSQYYKSTNIQNYEKKSTNKSEAKKSTRTRENKISPKTKGMGTYRITIFMLFTLIVERKLHKASPGNEQAFHVR